MEPPKNLRIGHPPRIASPWAERDEQDLAIQAWAPGDHGRSALPRVVLTGLGGIGKTQIAAAVYYDLSAELDLSLWVSARNLDEMVAAYAEAERSLATAGSQPDETSRATEDLAGEARRFLQRLEDKAVLRSWLVVLDDLSIPDRVMEHWWPPVNHHGRTLVTSRSFIDLTGRAEARVISVGTLPLRDSTKLLRSVLPAELSADDAVALDGLARQSQGLPAAVSQIAALLEQSSLTADEVLHRLVDPERLAQTFLLSGRLAEAEHQLMTLLAAQEQALAPDDPTVLATRANLASVLAKSGRLHEALEALQRLLVDQERVLGPDHPTTLTTRANLAQLHGQAGDTPYAIDQLNSLLVDQERVLGPDHPTTLTTRANLAQLHGQAGDTPYAIDQLNSLLVDQERVLGPDHPTTLTTRANLAQLHGQAGDTPYAIDQLNSLLVDQERVLGPDHPTTLTTRANLAQLHGQAGDTPYAIDQLNSLLVDQERVLGPDHPTTLTTRANLAQLHGQAGDTPYAIDQLNSLLVDQERVLGPDHPTTLTTREDLAFWLGAAGDPVAALAALQDVIASRDRRPRLHADASAPPEGDR